MLKLISADELMAMRYWEDLVVGETHHFGRHELTQAEIASFVDNVFRPPSTVAGDESAVPGFVLCGIAMRLLVDHVLSRVASLGSPGVDRIDWPHPARVGDVLTLHTEVLSMRPLKSRSEMGLAKQYMALKNDKGETVARFWTNILIARRETAS